jgi:hypothetical protein
MDYATKFVRRSEKDHTGEQLAADLQQALESMARDRYQLVQTIVVTNANGQTAGIIVLARR